MTDTVLGRIAQLCKAFKREHTRSPTKLYISPDDTAELVRCAPRFGRSIAERLNAEDIQVVLPKIHGLTVIYGADETKVE